MDNQKQEFDGAYLFAIVLKNKLYVLISVIGSMIISGIIAFSMPNWYSATVNAVPPQSGQGGIESAMGSISSTLKDIGLAKIGSKDDGYSFQVILQSRSIRDSLIKKYNLDKVYDIPLSSRSELYAALEENIEAGVEREGNYTVTITDTDPKRAAQMANDFINIVNNFYVDLYRREQKINKEYTEKRLNSVDSAIKAISTELTIFSADKMVFSPSDQAKAASSALADLKAQIYKSEIEYDLLKNNYGEDDPATKFKKDILNGARNKYNEALNQKGFVGNFTMKEGAGVGIKYLQMYTELEALAKVKGFLWPVYEKAKIDEARNLQSLIVLDYAQVPDKKLKPKRSLIIAGTGLGALIISILLIVAIFNYKQFRDKYKRILLRNDNK